jgi:hypothetical protein
VRAADEYDGDGDGDGYGYGDGHGDTNSRAHKPCLPAPKPLCVDSTPQSLKSSSLVLSQHHRA